MTHNNSGRLISREELDEVYTPIEVAKEEIWRRRNDSELKAKVETVLHNDIPSIFKESPRLVLARQVVSPNYELLRFLDLAKDFGIKPAFFEYAADKFITKNDDKYYLAKLYFYNGIGKKGGKIITSKKITDIDKYDGKPFSDMQTFSGDNFIEFHHMLAAPVIQQAEIYDISDNYMRNGEVAEKYYFYYLSLFLYHAVLAENYLLNDTYNELTGAVFYPNFKKVHDMFGIKPLIVRMVTSEEENDIHWRYYPREIRDTMEKILN